MVRLRHKATGVILNADEQTAAWHGATLEPIEEPTPAAESKSEPPRPAQGQPENRPSDRKKRSSTWQI